MTGLRPLVARILRRIGFQTLSTRLTLLYAALLMGIMIVVAVISQASTYRYTMASVRNQLVTSSSVFERIWTLRLRALGDSVSIMSRDFGFRAAVASGDHATIESALLNLRRRAGVGNAFVVEQDGTVIGETVGADAAQLKATVAAVPFKLPPNRREAVIGSGGAIFRIVVTPILAPDEIGWVVFALRLDRGEMRALEQLSAIPLTAAIVRRAADGGWVPATGDPGYSPGALDAFMASAAADGDQPGTLDLAQGSAIAIVRPLASTGDVPEAMLLLSYPLDRALALYRSLQATIVLVGLGGLVVVLVGSRRLARTIADPIAALDDAARALREGERSELTPAGSDEIRRLAESFNAMSAGIVEREHRIAHLAFHDTLTGLPNRAFFRQQLGDVLLRAKRTNEAVAVLCLNLDDFKGVNDTHGPSTGDALLRIVGESIMEVAFDGVVARLSGDEFAIILSCDIPSDQPRALSQAIVDRLHQPFDVGGVRIATSASIGIAVCPNDGEDAATLLKNANLALDRAKQEGRGLFRFFEPALDAAARRRRQIELDLREALQLGQLRLDYQPLLDLKSGEIRAFEALMRWDHPQRGPVSPVDFIPVAEETGLIIAIGEWVVHEACREAMHWPAAVRVAINVSPLQFRNSGFAAIVLQALGNSGLPPTRLEIEMTESIFLEGTTATLELLHRLRALGVRIALDDFGTGYSSLSYLCQFPFDKIKIDRSFVTNVATDERAAAIVRAIVGLATAFSMETTAEGVEDRDQLDMLRSLGCGSIQGFLLSRAVRAAEVNRLLASPAWPGLAAPAARSTASRVPRALA